MLLRCHYGAILLLCYIKRARWALCYVIISRAYAAIFSLAMLLHRRSYVTAAIIIIISAMLLRAIQQSAILRHYAITRCCFTYCYAIWGAMFTLKICCFAAMIAFVISHFHYMLPLPHYAMPLLLLFFIIAARFIRHYILLSPPRHAWCPLRARLFTAIITPLYCYAILLLLMPCHTCDITPLTLSPLPDTPLRPYYYYAVATPVTCRWLRCLLLLPAPHDAITTYDAMPPRHYYAIFHWCLYRYITLVISYVITLTWLSPRLHFRQPRRLPPHLLPPQIRCHTPLESELLLARYCRRYAMLRLFTDSIIRWHWAIDWLFTTSRYFHIAVHYRFR